MYYTDSAWSHVGVVVGQNRLSHATTAGVVEQPITDFFDGKTFVVARRPKGMTADGIGAALRFAEESRGAGYDWIGVCRFLLRIVFGASGLYRVRVSVDILLVAAMLIAFAPVELGLAIVALSAVYVLVVVANTRRRQRERAAINGAA
jgi:hypothetical protein